MCFYTEETDVDVWAQNTGVTLKPTNNVWKMHKILSAHVEQHRYIVGGGR